MAEAVVTYILAKLAVYLLEKARELREVRGQIEQMQKDLRLIQAFLKNADSKRNRDKLVKEWVNQFRDIAHKIEDVIDIYLVEIEEKCTKTFRSSTVADKFLKVGGELKEIMKNLNVIYQRRINLGITDLGASSEENDQPAFRPAKPSDVDDSQVVGLEDDKCMIINQLLDRDISRRTVLSILGTGGLGKTTLAQKIYKSAELEGQFDCLTWLSISQKFNLNNLLRDILYSIEPQMKDKNPPVSDEVILEKLKSSLGSKRYLIVLDDVWTTELWERMKLALPDVNKASRVIITTRSLDVAKAADCNTKPYKLHYLSDADGLALLFRNTFQEEVQPENYPHLLEVAKRLTKKCGGLPLALVVLGSILRTRDRTYYAWSKVEDTMDWHDKDGEKCMKILALSYKDLPHYLKPCFLYFASFPANHKILGKHVTRMWLAEGFVPKDGAGTMEDRADEFLEELVHRSLIEVTKKSWNGYCKYCSMHGLLRDLAIHEAKEENFFTVFSDVQGVNQLAARKPRRAAMQFCTLTKDGVYSKNTRTLLCFDSNDSGFGLLDYSGFRLLRVLTLEKVDMSKLEQRQWPNNLVHLRYLGLRKCTIPQEIFKKIFFYNLETLDLKDSELLPKQVTKNWSDIIIPTLRHVYGSIYIRRCLPLKWHHHTNLQTVKDVVLQREVAKLGCCINLRTLGISYKFGLTNEMALKEWANLKGVLNKTKQLVNLGITTTGLLPFGGTIDLPCHEKIQKLHLDGIWVRNICVLSVEMFPTNLTKLTLQLSGLEEDAMPILERLQSLKILHLDSDSYMGTEMICSTGGFPNLEKLKFVMLPNLCHWDIKEGAMPIVTHIIINDCNELHTLPKLQNVRTLQELLVIWPSRELHESMQGKDLHKIEHIPSVRIRSN